MRTGNGGYAPMGYVVLLFGPASMQSRPLRNKNGRGGASTAETSGFHRIDLAEATGFEPAVSALTGLHVRPLHHASSGI